MKGGTSQACAACKYQRRRCYSECPLAPYFPGNQPKMFRNSHRLYGVSNIMKILRRMETQEQRDEAMRSVIYESDMRERFPVHGCCGIIRHLYCQLMQAVEELQHVRAQLAMCADGCHNQIVDPGYFSPLPEQFGMNLPGDVLVGVQHFSINEAIPFEGHHHVTSEDNHVYVESNGDTLNHHTIQYPNYNSVAIQTQLFSFHLFPTQQETEVDFDDIPIDTLADDRQSYIESKEECESSCESSWKNITHSLEHTSKNDLKSAAACFKLTNTE
ncbi:hypothetical protein Vadar_004534 [Vaccinium darrowii]|uniref:Uncharacterized protein n=1 Tax=Vaccinium darrowii TaxID=229202 RepID=A0ACB7XX43_9ERIC|nr:hypothetical protein Vadar_004534 [Vaccinium darrowii]